MRDKPLTKNDGGAMWAAVETARVKRDKANDALFRVLCRSINDLDREVDRLEVAAAKANDDLADAKREAFRRAASHWTIKGGA